MTPTLLFGPVQPGDGYTSARCAVSWQPPSEPAPLHLGFIEKVEHDNGNVSYQFSAVAYAASTRDAVLAMVQEQLDSETA